MFVLLRLPIKLHLQSRVPNVRPSGWMFDALRALASVFQEALILFGPLRFGVEVASQCKIYLEVVGEMRYI
jgi:hypothetical protein